ncbi:MAG TPA: peptidase M16 [Anaerolineae bacterium]|nr:peptidase M16 [Anaerolineae bacterium]
MTTTTHGFELIREEYIDELNSTARLYRHRQTGAEMISLSNDDENKSFGITFRTPPPDSTGVPHIMEHSVLGGSRKYRVKEPFIELAKGSFKTFLNAMTFPDMTSYPVATTNLQEFYNLVDVYLDAVFHPLITPFHLEQEGWHFELDDVEAPLIYKGIVFNEMKGAMSSPENLHYYHTMRSVFPDNTYRNYSGGNPQVMPELTYEDFRSFHETYYHPANARIFFYGDDPEEERLRLMNEYLQDFAAAEIASEVTVQPPFAEPRRAAFPYSVDGDGDHQDKAYISLNWALPESYDPALQMALGVMSYAILGTSGAPLRKTLVDSGLGDDVIGGGLSSRLRQMTFSVGMKGVKTADVDKVESLILETLEKLAAEGIDPEQIEAALNTIEFSYRENNTGSFPRGLSLMFRTLSNWLYDQDPLQPLKFEAPLTAVREQITQNPAYLPELIREYLLNNPHRVTVILEPDVAYQQRLETAEKEKLAAIKSQLTAEQLEGIVEHTQTLRALQEKPDDPEALAAIPRLTLADLDRENKLIPIETGQAHGAQLLYHDLFTNGIVYLEAGFDLHTLPQDLLPYVPLFGRALVDMGTEMEDFVRLQQRIGQKTGGIYPTTLFSAKRDEAEAVAWLFLRGKSTVPQAGEMLGIMRDALLTVNLDNQERFRQMVLRAKAGLESGLIPGGHGVVNGRLRSYFSESGWLNELTGGVAYLFFLRRLAEDVEQDWPGVLAKLEAVRETIINQSAMLCNVTLDAANWAIFRPQLEAFVAEMPQKAAERRVWDWRRPLTPEGLTIPAQVNYVAKGTNIYDLGYELNGSISVINNYLRTTYLWEKIRVLGGAYGGMVSFSPFTGVYSFLSYRDPNLLSTLANYDGAADFLRQPIHEDELTKSIIGAISSMDAYQLPDAKGYTSMVRYLTNSTDEYRQRMREDVLGTTQADFTRLADVLARVNDTGLVTVLGSVDAINQANAEMGGDWLDIKKVM